VSFGSIAVGSTATQSLSVTNTGLGTVTIASAALTGAGITVVGGNPAGTIGVGQSSTIQLQFAPTSAGAINGSLTILSDASNSPLAISITGTGTQAGLTIAPSALTFGNVIVGQSGTQSVKLTNSGNSSVTINLATVAGTGFGITGLSLPTTLTGGQSISFNAQFTPTAVSAASGTITFTDNAPGSPQVVSMVGTGVATNSSLVANPGSLAFGNVSVGSSSPQTITLTNTGNTSATISAISASGTGFSATGLTVPLILAANQSTTFTAQFAPTTVGAASGTITVTSTATDPTVSIALSGSGVQGNLTANPTSINFGSLLVGASGSVSVTLKNAGTASVTISQGSASGTGFSITGLAAPQTLTAGQSTSFTAKFSPTTAGSATGSISIVSNAPGSPLAIDLSGSGTASQPQLTINPASVAFGSASVGSTVSQTVTLSNPGTAALTVTQAVPSGTGFSMSGASMPMTINAGSSASFSAIFAPTATGAVSGSISVVSNAPGSPAAIALTGTGIQGQVGATPSSANFGSVAVGSSGSQTITLTNSGTASVAISQVSTSGTGFSMTGLAAPMTLAAGQSTSFTAKFSPTAAGSATGSISIVSNATGSPLVIALSGSGTATQPQLTISPASVAFGSVSVGSSGSQTVTLTNAGNATLTVSQATSSGTGFSMSGASMPMTINAGSSASFSAIFAPTATGAVSGSISVVSNAPGSPAAIALTGTGIQGQVGATPSSANFGSVAVGSSGSQTITLTNSGTASVAISQVSTSGTGFSMTGLAAPMTLAAGQSTSFTAKFSPTAAGSATGSISIVSNATGSPLVIALSGSGTATQPQLTISPASVAFGSVSVGSSGSQTVTLTNAGNATLTVSQATSSGTGFSMSGASMPMTINAGSSASFSAVFAPTAMGPASGSISVVSNAPGSPAAIALTGTGIQGQLGATPSSVNFGSVAVGSSGSQTITLTNSGTASVTISAATASGTGLSISGLSTPLTLGAGLSTTFSAQFAPTSAGSMSGSISVVSNAPTSPLTIPLSGTATQPQLAATPSTAALGSVVMGSNNSQTISLANNGTATLTISSAAVTGAGFSTTGLTLPVSIAAGKTSTFNAVFAPSAAGSVSGSISLVSNAPNSPFTISLSGTGVAATQVLGLGASSLSFGNVNVGSSSSLNVTVTNNGNSNVTISNVSVKGAGFSASGLTSGEILTPTQSATLTAQFAPTAAGLISGSVSIASNATNSPSTITVSGTGVSVTPNSVALSWTASTSTVTGYNVYRGTISGGPYAQLNSSLVTAVNYTDSTVTAGVTYYYVITAVNSSNVESADSNQATAVIP
jgi:Abnormal spindle-like microcephaly-assoc'd, ASPM-SPD-2-Hydin